MARTTTLLALLALCLPAVAAEAAARDSHADWIELSHLRFQSCAPDHPYRRIQEVSLKVERREATQPICYLRYKLSKASPPSGRAFQARREPVELPLTVHGCDGQDLSALSGGVGTFRCRGRSGVLVVSRTRVRGCTLNARLSDGFADVITGPDPGGSQGPRPDPGGPDQGVLAAQALPNLKIRSAEAVAGDPTKLSTRVVNVGPGPSGKTRLKLFVHTPQGQVLTAHEQVPALSAGQQAVVAIGVGQPLAAAKTVTLRVDDPNVVPETSELDNGFTFKK